MLPSGKFQARARALDRTRFSAGTRSTLKEALYAQDKNRVEIDRFGFNATRIDQTAFAEFAEIAFLYREHAFKVNTSAAWVSWLTRRIHHAMASPTSCPSNGDVSMKHSDAIVPFVLDLPESELADLRHRLSDVRLPGRETTSTSDEAEGADWSQGVPRSYLSELAQH